MKISIKIESGLGSIDGTLDLGEVELTHEESAVSALEWVRNLLNATYMDQIDWSLMK